MKQIKKKLCGYYRNKKSKSVPKLLDRPTVLLFSHSPLVAHFFLRKHIEGLSEKFKVVLAHNEKLDQYCQSLTDLCEVRDISIQRKLSFGYDVWTLIQFSKLILELKPKIIISVTPKSGMLGMFVARQLRVPVRLHIFQGVAWTNKTGFFKKVLQYCDRLIIKNATHMLSVSTSEKKLLETTFPQALGKIVVLGDGSICGVNNKFFTVNKEIVRKKYNFIRDLPQGAKVCVYLGRICYEKGIENLIDAFCMLDHSDQDKRLVLVGPEENFCVAEKIKNIDVEIQSFITVHGFTDLPELMLASADFVCLPSHREGLGLMIIEAAAMGIPAVGTRIVGISDAIIENQTGLLCEPKNSMDLAKYMNIMYNDDVLRKRLGENAKARASECFRQSEVVSKYTKYIEGII